MKKHLLPLLSIAVSTALCLPSGHAQDGAATKPTLIQAEATAETTGAKVYEDAKALGGSYTMHPKDFNPVFKVETPSGATEYTIWVRARGVGLQLKAAPSSDGGSQEELKWIWKIGDDWGWKSFGKFPVDKLGASIVIIRGKNPKENAGLDAVILSSNPAFDPTKDGALDGLSDK